ncbi:MAG: 50S ribosomal protein L6 [Mycoplasmataceae bacterium]|nr:50S ribosomal protein L6 [Mycoplasmataceae bacterium]
MSKVGRREIAIPQEVEVIINGNDVTIKGPKGELKKTFSPLLIITVVNDKLKVERKNEIKQTKMLHGTTNSLLSGMVDGVTKGFEKELQIVGVGYRVEKKDGKLVFSLGLSHKIELEVPSNLVIEVISQTELKISGIDKQQVGEFAAKIRGFRKPEPYGGKGIRYKGEYIRRKAGKAGQK